MSRKVTSLLHAIANVSTATMTDRVRMKTKSGLISKLKSDLKTELQTKHGPVLLLTERGLHIAGAVDGFETDEPETRSWIDSMSTDDVLWDIGANIGLYSLYAGKRPDGPQVYSFEPSGLNFGLMVEHVHINGLGGAVKPFCLALGEKTEMTTLYGNADAPGHTSNNIHKAEDQFGSYDVKFEQAIPVFSMDDFVKLFKVPQPTHLKLDVDGVETEILKGGPRTLKGVKSLIVEIEGEESRQAELIDLILGAGFKEAEIENRTAKTRNRLFVR